MQAWKDWLNHLTDRATRVVTLLEQNRFLDAQENFEEFMKSIDADSMRRRLQNNVDILGPGIYG